MPTYSERSMNNLLTCDVELQILFNRVVKTYDCTIIEGHRSRERQDELYKEGKTKVRLSEHNSLPSMAVDAAPWFPDRHIPWPVPGTETYWKDLHQFYHFAGYVLGVAKEMGIRIRWGGDWDRDNNVRDQSFNDLVHFEREY